MFLQETFLFPSENVLEGTR